MLSDAFATLKSNLELTDSFGETISQHHSAVRSAIENLGKVGIETRLIGSLQRQTRIHPRPEDDFDIDILVELGSFDHWTYPGDPNGITPQMAMNRAHDLVDSSDRYRAMRPQQDHPTVMFSYADGVRVELVPAYRDRIGRSSSGIEHGALGRGYWIPDSSGNWSLADYDYDAAYVSSLNQGMNGLFIPVVKMLKAVKRTHFPAMKSYHLEVIAAHVIPIVIADFKTRNVPLTYPNLVAGFLHQADNHWFGSLKLHGSNSQPIEVGQLAQAQITNVLAPLKEVSKQAMMTGSDREKQSAWRVVFGDVMPAP